MKRLTRLVLLAAAAVASLAVAAPAFASFTGTMAVASSGTETAIDLKLPQTNDPAARIAIYVPTGYTVNLNQAAGTTIGTTSASAFSRDTNLTLPLSGNVTVDNPANHTSDVCSPGNNAAVWILNLSVAGQTIALPVYVNPTSGAEAAIGPYKIVTCLPPPDVPQGTPGRSVQGAQVLEAVLDVKGIFTPPSAADLYAWEGFFTPYNPGVGTANPLGTIEVRSLVSWPVRATIVKAKYVLKTNTFTLTGRLTAGGAPVTGAVAVLYRGFTLKSIKRIATTTVKKGTFKFTAHLAKKKTTYFRVAVGADQTDVTSQGGCASPITTAAPAGCVSATLAPFVATTPYIRVKL